MKQTLGYPSNIIVETDLDVSEFMFWLQPFEYMEPDYRDVLIKLIAALGFEKYWKQELSKTCNTLMDQLLGYTPIDASEMDYEKLGLLTHYQRRQAERNEMSQRLFKLGSSIQNQLKTIKAYQSGYLYYSFDDFIGKDILLHRLLFQSIRDNPNNAK